MSQGGEVSGVRLVHGGLVTAPPDSATVTAAFGNLALATPKQNTLGYDIILNIEALSSNAVAAQLQLGVGPTSTPTLSSVASSFTGIGIFRHSFVAYVPANYWVEVSYSGALLTISYTTQAMAV